MLKLKWLPMAALIACSLPAAAQLAPDPAILLPATEPEPEVEGATPDRVAQVERCQGHKFDTMVEIDPLRKRSTRVKLCANPGSSDADWVTTLEAAIVQIEQRAMPAEAKDKVIGELRAEIAKFAAVAGPAPSAPSSAQEGTINLGGFQRDELIAPTERFETSVVPPLPAPLPRRVAGTASTTSATTAAIAAPPRPAMRFRIKCLARGESGSGSSCDFFDSGTVIALSAVEGLEKGGTLRFRRRGEERGTVSLSPLAAGKSVRVRLPAELCRGVAFTKVELELLAPGSTGVVADRAGPYDVRC